MKTIILQVMALCLICFSVYGQSPSPHSIKGIVTDTASKVNLPNTSIGVLQAKDSILVKYNRARPDGSFSINNLPAGKFILMLTYPGYADYVEAFSLDAAHPEHDFGKLNLILKARLLAEVMIKGQVAAMKIKGDTTEFNAAAFKIQPNSKVEDLLKQLPGIQVDKDGKITAQGQTVSKVLVDGEEFFGDDPTLVTKNIRGDMVDKVQLFDKKSDQATFTGVDDGVRTKTINIKLKEGSKNGYFGKTDFGGATDDFYQGQAMFNKFKAKQKFSMYGTVGNNGKTGLGWEDSNKYGASGGNVEVIDGGIMIMGNSDDLEGFEGRYYGQGIPLARTGGVHYDTKWKDDKYSLNTNYKIGSIAVDGIQNTLTQNNLPTGLINSNSDQSSNNFSFRQKVDLTYQVKLDSSSNLKIMLDGTLKNSETRSQNSSLSARGNGIKLNSSSRNLSNDGEQQLFNISLLWTKRLKKAGRNMSFSMSEALNDNQMDGFLLSTNGFYNTLGNLDSTGVVDQYKTSDSKSAILNTNLTYTEPLSKVLSVVMNLGFALNNSEADRKSFNKSASGRYEILDNQFSNHFELEQISKQAGAVLSYRKGKQIASFGTKAVLVDFNQTDLRNNIEYKRNFLNWTPQGSWQYRFNTNKSMSIRYNGNTSQPRLDQIQPVRDNNDPLNISLGNPNLKPSYRNSFSLNYNSYKVLSDKSIYISSNYSFTSNAIVGDRSTDEAGKTVIQSVNLNGKTPLNYSVYLNYGRKIKPLWDINVGLNVNTSGNTNFNYSNTALNTTKSLNFSSGLNLSKYIEKKFDFSISYTPGYTKSESSLQKQLNNNGRTSRGYFYFNFYLPKKVQLGGDMNYEFRAKTKTFNEDFSRTIVNTTLSKKFMKAENLKLSLSGNDLLNQNIGFSRNAFSSTVTQNSYNTIKRYYMLSLIWDFSKMGGAPSPKSN